MKVDLRPATRRMIEESQVPDETWAFIQWLHTEHYTDYTIDCHVRRLLFVMPRLAPGSSSPIFRDDELAVAFGRECRPRSRLFNFAGTRRVYTRYLSAQGRLVTDPDRPWAKLTRQYDDYLAEVRGLSVSARCHHLITVRMLLSHVLTSRRSLKTFSRDDVERFILKRSQGVSRHTLQHEVAHLRAFLRYAHDAGLVTQRLDGLDTPRTYRGELPPLALPWRSVQRLLRSIDRASRCGWRDLCILHLIAYYGLRPGEVVALRRWYEEGLDVQSELPKLSLYMGHVSIASTTYYLRFMPAVVTLASERFASTFAEIIEGGAV
jgi:hypothetical protein